MILALACLLCAAVPAALFCINLRLYAAPPSAGDAVPRISILIPARNEEVGIAACVQSALASTGAAIEVIVMDDSSTDRTAAIVQSLIPEASSRSAAVPGAAIPRFPAPILRLEQAPALPPGWNGKQHACWELAHAASGEILCFVDADVRLAPDAVSRMAAFLHSSQSELVSGFPRQITVTWLEQLLLPLIHFVLLGFLPLFQARKSQLPGYAAGCGQFLMVQRHAYFASGGHAEIRATMHDGIKLPRLVREHGFRTDLADLTSLASCRMYTTSAQVWNGLAKNATEGMAAPAAILPATFFLLVGQVVPFLLLRLVVLGRLSRAGGVCVVLAVAAAWLPRLLALRRFRQPFLSALLHPLGVVLLLAVQWYALLRSLAGARVTWKSRAYSAG